MIFYLTRDMGLFGNLIDFWKEKPYFNKEKGIWLQNLNDHDKFLRMSNKKLENFFGLKIDIGEQKILNISIKEESVKKQKTILRREPQEKEIDLIAKQIQQGEKPLLRRRK